MASHLTVTTTSSAGISSSKGLNSQSAAETGGDILGIFASLLGASTPAADAQTVIKTGAQLGADINLGNLVDLSFGFGDGEADTPDDPELIAAALDAALPIQMTPEVKAALTDLIDGLAELKANLAAGETLDPDALEKLAASLDDLTAALDIDLSALPSADELGAMVTDLLPEDQSLSAQLTRALAPLAQTLLSGEVTVAADGEAEAPALVSTIGDKLAALVKALDNKEIAPEKLAALGLDLDAAATLDTELDAVLAKLAAPAIKVEATAAPVLAVPTLKLTEPALTGKADAGASNGTDATTETETTDLPEGQIQTGAAAKSNGEGDAQNAADKGPSKPADKPETKPVAAAGPQADTMPDPQASTQTAHQASRVDAAAAPRAIQAGYQTSQQQLNLPQLAFELVRQVNDGNTRFQIRLDPPELGKIDVKLDIDRTGQITARLTVEKAETLDLMQRDQRGLERALQQAGLDSAKTNLEFSLKQNPFAGQQNQNGNSNGGGLPSYGATAGEEVEEAPPTVNLYRGSLTASGVNIIA